MLLINLQREIASQGGKPCLAASRPDLRRPGSLDVGAGRPLFERAVSNCVLVMVMQDSALGAQVT